MNAVKHDKQEKPVLIIDGYGFIFRAYHVQPALTSPSGMPIGAIYGFTSMLLKILNDFKPEHAVVVLDYGGKNFRHQIYSNYKANRPQLPEDLIVQLKLIPAAAKALNFAILQKEGFEADDIIATLAKETSLLHKQAVIVSSDKDLMQLINEDIQMYDPVGAKYISALDVVNKFGVTPDKVREVLALIGDKSDNIPGVSGIGPKNAAHLISSFGTVELLLNSIAELPNKKHQEMLRRDHHKALMSWQLLGLDYNVDIDIDITRLKWVPPSRDNLIDFFNRYGFKSLYKRAETLFNFTLTEQPPESLSSSHQIVKTKKVATIEEFRRILQDIEIEGIVGINLLNRTDIGKADIELALYAAEVVYIIKIFKQFNNISGSSARSSEFAKDLFSFCNKNNSNNNANNNLLAADNITLITEDNIVDFTRQSRELISELFANPGIKKITFNLKLMLKAFPDYNFRAFEDLQLMNYCLNAGNSGSNLADIIKCCLPEKVLQDSAKQDPQAQAFKISVSNEVVELTAYFIRCYRILYQQLYINQALYLYSDIDLPICYILNDMEQQGVTIDIKYLLKLSEQFTVRIKELEQEIFLITKEEFNISSPKKLGEILFTKMQLPFAKLAGKLKTYATGADILEKLHSHGYPIAALLLKYRQLTKLKNTYTDNLPKQVNKDNRVHTTFLQTSTATGRLSSLEPNVQNIPTRTEEGRQIRKAFIPKAGYKLIAADYSQIELRILSHVADIPALKKAFTLNKDIHTQTASQIFGQPEQEITPSLRRSAKAINFGIIYGISSFGLARQLDISQKEAANYIAKYFQEYPEIKQYMNDIISFARKHGYVQNLLGRKCFVPDINNKNHSLRAFAQRAAINAPMQSLAADIVKIAMIKISNILKAKSFQTKLLLQIHDELIFEAPQEEVEKIIPLIKAIMENAYYLDVATRVDITVGDNWQKMD